MRLLIVCPYPPKKAPSQRFRFEQYLDGLEVPYRQVGFWKDSEWPKIYRSGNFGFKVSRTLLAFFRRFFLLFSVWRYDKVFVHREATPIGPPWFEWFVVKVFRKPLVYDFDDAVWLANASEANAKLVGMIKNHNKVGKICRWAEVVVVGNEFLSQYARGFNVNVVVVPTTIDTELLHNKELYQVPSTKYEEQSKDGLLDNNETLTNRVANASVVQGPAYGLPTIGWTGTHSTLKQLIPLFPLLEEVYREHPFRFLLIADTMPEEMPGFVEFCTWNKETEIADLMRMDIGIMPLYDTDWERGKCGFKALQYMALGIPAVVSDVGVNPEIVVDDVTGCVCEAVPTDGVKWKWDLLRLFGDDRLRKQMGVKGRERVIANYSVHSQTHRFKAIINS